MGGAYRYVTDRAGIQYAVNFLWNEPVLALDLETTGLDPLVSRIRLISLGNGKDRFIVDAFKCERETEAIYRFIREYKGLLIGHNLKFDLKFLAKAGCTYYGRVFDTHTVSRMLDNGNIEVKHDLIAVLNGAGITYSAEDLGGSDWAGNLSQAQLDYAAEDVSYLHKLLEHQKGRLAQAGMGQACKIDCDVIIAEAELELAGFRLDQDMWKELADANGKEAERIAEELLRELPRPDKQLVLGGIGSGFDAGWNLASQPKLLKSLQALGIDLESTNRKTLVLNGGKHELLAKLIEYRKYSKAVSSFGPDYLEHIHSSTGRIHSSYWPFTGAGRYSCSGPNLQQIPREKAFRLCFRPGPGKALVVCDYSQIELRLMAEISGDETLRQVFRDGIDAHTNTAAIISATSKENVTKDARQKAKPVNFGLMYGMGPEKLGIYSKTEYGVDLSETEAKLFHKRYFQAYRGVKKWHRQAVQDGQRTGESRTLSGRRRFLDKDCYSEFLNTPVQGTGADGLKRAMRLFTLKKVELGLEATLVNVVHDEMVVECPKAIATQVGQLVSECMKEGMAPFVKSVPIVAEVSVGESWADK